MKAFLCVALTVAALTLAVDTRADGGFDAHRDASLRLGADLPFLVPVGSISETQGVGLGIALLRLEYFLRGNINLTARIGYMYQFEKNGVRTGQAPILFPGVKYYIESMYIGGEAGINLINGSFQFGETRAANTEARFGMSATVGYEIGDVDLRGGLWVPSLGHIGDGLHLYLSVGYSFYYF